MGVRAADFKGRGVLVGVPALFLAAYLYPFIPVLSKFRACAVRHFLGVVCPGCGMTTSFIELAHGHLRTSIASHPLGLIVAGWLAYQFGRGLFAAVAGRPPRELLAQDRRNFLLYVFLIALAANWIVRLAVDHLIIGG